MFCVVTGSEDVSPNVRTFATDSHIEDALDGAGVNLLRIWNELRAITSGIPTFMEISEDEARKLELIGG
jgi:hypothetical protein